MIRLIPSDERFRMKQDWIDARWHFSFGHYHDPSNIRFGPLRVFNDDTIQPASGFPQHPHDNMEIITIVLEGQLQHTDSIGNTGLIHPNEVQVMSAGSGIKHSEFNASADQPLRLMQLWVMPRNKNQQPAYAQQQFDPQAQENKWLPLVSSGSVKNGGEISGTLGIDQDASIHRARLTESGELTWQSTKGRRTYIFVIDGQAQLNNQPLHKGDQARIEDEPNLTFNANNTNADLLLIDLP